MRKKLLRNRQKGWLQSIAWNFNSWKTPVPPEFDALRQAWLKAEDIVKCVTGDIPSRHGKDLLSADDEISPLHRSTIIFNKFFAEVPVRLGIAINTSGGVTPWMLTMSENPDPRSEVAIRLWSDYFKDPNRDRLKQCWLCLTWFVDETKNKLKHFCSSRCSSKWWTRGRRRVWKTMRGTRPNGKQLRSSPLTRVVAIAILDKAGRLEDRRQGKRPSLQESTERKSAVS